MTKRLRDYTLFEKYRSRLVYMKIFIDGMIFGRQQIGGISRVWEELLKRLPNYNVEVKLLVPIHKKNYSLNRLLKQKDKYSITQDYFYWPIRYFERISVRSNILNWFYLDDTIEIFHSTFLSTVYDKKVKKVITIHDMIPEVFQNENRNKWTAFIINMKKRVLKNADKIIAISQKTKNDILYYYPWIHEEKITVIHNGFTTFRIDEKTNFNSVIKKYSIKISPMEYFLFIGNLTEYKNIKLIYQLFESKYSYRNSIVLCIGSKIDHKLAYIFREKGLLKNFIFIEFVEDDELSVFYRNALALIYPSKYEGFGLPILEAMANECPVVCSNTSCLPEIAGRAAFYFSPDSVDSLDSAINELLRLDREKIIKRGLKNVARFSWEKSTRALVDLYSDLSNEG